MTTKRLSNEFMEKILNDVAWKELSGNFKWTEQTLERHMDKVDWKDISNNREILWTPSMLEKFKKFIDWSEFSTIADNEILLSIDNLEKFKNYWDWSKLSSNSYLELTIELIDKFIELWDWSELIDRFYDNIYTIEFLERYIDRIPVNKLQDSALWKKLVEKRKSELAFEVVS